MVIMSDMITRLEYIMNTENPTSEERHLEELPEFYHVKLKLTGKRKYVKCSACWRLLFNDQMVLKHRDRKYAFYCTGSKHIESSEEYLKYLVEVQSIELGTEYLTGQLNSMTIEWSRHRHRNKVEILSVSELPIDNAKREEVEKYQKNKAMVALEKRLAQLNDAHKNEVQKIIAQMTELENN